MVCSRCASSATAGGFPRWRASSSRTIPSSSCAWPRRPAGTDADPARPGPGTARPPPATPGPAHPRGHRRQLRIRRAQPRRGTRRAAHGWRRPARPGAGRASASASSRAASPQSCAAWACRTASTGYPCPANQPRGGPVQPGDLARLGAPQLQRAADRRTGGGSGTTTVPRPAPPRTRWPASRSCSTRSPPLSPVSRSASSPFTRSSTLVRSSSRRTGSACRSSTSASRYSATVRSVPENSGREPPRIRVPGQRQRRQPQPRRPPLGPLCSTPAPPPADPPRRRRTAPAASARVNRRSGRADLGQLALQPQPVQAQPHVMPGGQHEPQPRRGPHDQQLQLPQRIRAQLVHVIDHQPQPVLQRRQVRQQPLGDRPPVQIRRRRHRLHQRRPRGRLAQRAQHRQPEPLRIALIPPGRHPRGAPGQARLADPGPQQHRLAAARRRRHHGHPGLPPSRPNSPGRATTPPAPGPATRPATASDPSPGPTPRIIPRPVKRAHYTPVPGRARSRLPR